MQLVMWVWTSEVSPCWGWVVLELISLKRVWGVPGISKRGLCFCCITAECTDPSSCSLVTPGRLCWVYRNLGATSHGRLFPRAPPTEPPKLPEFPSGLDPISSSPIPSPAQGSLLFVSMLLRKKVEALNAILKS